MSTFQQSTALTPCIDLFAYQSKIQNDVTANKTTSPFRLNGYSHDSSRNAAVKQRTAAGLINSFLAGVETRAYRIAYAATGNREDALDIVQEAMIKLVQKYSDRDESEWGPLFHRIVQSKIRDWYRRNKLRNGLRSLLSWGDGGDPLDNLPDQKPWGPDLQTQADQTISALEAAIHQLPLRQQQAFMLRCWEGLNTAETAKAMSCSTGSVKTHYSRALNTLRTRLEGQQL